MRIKILILELEGLMAESGSGQVNEANLAFWLAGPSKLLGISHIGPRLKKFLFYSHINPFAPEPPVRIQVLSTLCDVISFNS